MLPLKSKLILAPLSTETLSEETVLQVARAFFKHTQQKLTSLDSMAVDVAGLGIFVIKPGKLSRKILRIKGLIEKMGEPTSLRSFSILEEKRRELAQLEKLQEKVLSEKSRKQKIRQSRYEKPAQHLEEQGEDS